MAYEVVRTERVTAQFEKIRSEFERFDELEKAIRWFLERSPRNLITYDLKKQTADFG